MTPGKKPATPDQKPNIVFFLWDNLGWGEAGCNGGGVLRGAPTPRIDALAAQGLRLLNFNVEAQCTPSRSAILTGRHPIRSGTHTIPITGGPEGLTRWEVSIAQALSDSGYATGMWDKWHLGSDPEKRSPVEFGFDEAVWSPRTADEVMWTMQSYFPKGAVTSAPYAGKTQIPMELQPIYSKKKGSKAKVIATYDAKFRTDFDRKITEWAIDFMSRSKRVNPFTYICLTRSRTSHRFPIPSLQARPSAGAGLICWLRWMLSPAGYWTSSTSWGSQMTRSWFGHPITGVIQLIERQRWTLILWVVNGTDFPDRGAVA